MLNSQQQQQQQDHRHLQQLQVDHQQQQQNHYQHQQIICGLEPQDLTVSTSIASSIAGIGSIGGGGSGNKSGSDHHLEFLSNANKISSLVISPGAADVGVRQMRNLSDQVHAAAVGGGGGIGIGGNSATSGNNPNSSNSGAKLNSSGSSFFTFNELSKALQQQDQQMNAVAASAISPSSTSSIVFNSSTSPTGGVGGILSANSNMTSNSSSSSVINSNRIASVSPPTSSHSSNSLNLGNSGSDSPGTVHDHHSYHRHHGMQQHYQHLPILGNLGNNFGLGSVRNNSSGSLSGNNNNPLQQHSQMQRSFSSTSSSIASPPSSISQSQQQQQHHPFQQQQHQQQPPHHHHHHHHNQQQHHHHHHQPYQPQNSPSSASKSCWCFANSDTTYHFKTLVPAVAAGAIIGKGGETIASLQRDTGARVKMSKSHDFYPGTSERVCLITGSVDAIICVLEFIMEKIREKPDLTTKITDIEAKQSQDRDKQVKILVPNSTAGMIIGKAGAYIKQIKEDSGSYVQISQKPKDITLQERCITIIGEKDNNKIACKMILSKIVEDPQSGTCLNVSYADINGPVANYNPTGSPYASNQAAISSSTASLNTALGNSVGGAGLLVNGTGLNLSLNLGAPNPAPNPAIASQILDHIKVGMRGSGYGESATSEVCSALGILAKYGVLGVGVGLPHTNGAHSAPVSYLGVSALEQSAAAATAASGVFGALGQVNLEQYINQSTAAPRTLDATAQFDAFRHPGPQAATPISINNNSFGLTAATTGATALSAMGALSKSPTPGDLGAKETKNVEIGEGIVGAILGPNGRSLIEIQHVSGANIQISKKGIFAPGTRNRIVTISGQPNAIAMAHFLIETKINEEEAKRARQNPVANVIQ